MPPANWQQALAVSIEQELKKLLSFRSHPAQQLLCGFVSYVFMALVGYFGMCLIVLGLAMLEILSSSLETEGCLNSMCEGESRDRPHWRSAAAATSIYWSSNERGTHALRNPLNMRK